MAQPVHFFHFFVVNPQFRQSVFDAGLTFHPDTDPANPVLVNLNSTRFGMAERITPLSPPAVDPRPNPLQSPLPPPATSPLPLSPVPDRPPVPILQPLPSPQSPAIPFLNPTVTNSFEGAKSVELPSPNPDQTLHIDPYMNGAHTLDLAEAMYAHDPNMGLLDDNLARQFADGARIEASDSESERLSEADSSLTNGSRIHLHTPTNITSNDAHLPPSERRRAGRRKVVSRVQDIRIPSSPICKRLSDRAQAELVQQIEEVFPRITLPKDYASTREDLLVRLRNIISAEWEGAGIDVYGSAGNGLGLQSADVDMSLYMPKEVAIAHGREKGKPDHPKVILARLATIMEENDMVILSRVLEARVPVIKMLDRISELQVDVCVNNTLAVKNTELLKAYVDLDERFRYVCILVKLWAKRRDLNDAYNGTLSSYAYTLLVIHYLQTLQPPVLPCLQQMHNGKRVTWDGKLPKELTRSGTQKLYNIYFDRTVTSKTFQSANLTPVHELLLGFFKYYAYNFKYRTDLVSIRLGTKASRATRGWDEHTVYREWESKQVQYRAALEAAKTAIEERKKADAEEYRLSEEQSANGEDAARSELSVNQTMKERITFPRRPRLESKHLFCIEDPFDIDHDLSRGMEKSAVTVIRQEMMRAYEMMAETGDFEVACEEWN